MPRFDPGGRPPRPDPVPVTAPCYRFAPDRVYSRERLRRGRLAGADREQLTPAFTHPSGAAVRSPPRKRPGVVVGVDGGRKGAWIAVQGFGGVTTPLAPSVQTLEDILLPRQGPTPDVVAIDVPIGLLDQPTPGGRQADRAARALLGPRKSSVFPPPCRPALERARDLCFSKDAYREVARVSEQSSPAGLRLSKQTFFLMARIAEVDDYLRAHPEARHRIYEVHPELAFLALSDGRALPPKKTFRGKLARLRLLEQAGLSLTEEALALEDDPRASPDDILDACACLWSAGRIAQGMATCLPESPPLDRFGLPMAIRF